MEVELTDDARTLLGNLGYDPTYGARPLKRVIQKRLVDKLALKLLEGEFQPGDRVLVDASDGELTFAKAATAARGRRGIGSAAWSRVTAPCCTRARMASARRSCCSRARRAHVDRPTPRGVRSRCSRGRSARATSRSGWAP